MNRREAIVAGGALLASGCQVGVKSQIKIGEEEKRCPCIDPDLNATNPLERDHLHICAFHIARFHPVQYEVTHYCTAIGDGRFQCILYDSPEKDAKLVGVEYVITDELYQKLPDGLINKTEKKYWHHHGFEIKEGLLAVLGVLQSCEDKLMKALVNSWGKTWHTWPDFDTFLPVGEPMLMWSAGKDRNVKPELIKKRDEKYGIVTDDIKKHRDKLLGD